MTIPNVPWLYVGDAGSSYSGISYPSSVGYSPNDRQTLIGTRIMSYILTLSHSFRSVWGTLSLFDFFSFSGKYHSRNLSQKVAQVSCCRASGPIIAFFDSNHSVTTNVSWNAANLRFSVSEHSKVSKTLSIFLSISQLAKIQKHHQTF